MTPCASRYGKIIGFEPDADNYKATCNFIKYGEIENVTIYNIALWSSNTIKKFYSGSDDSGCYNSSNLFRDVKDIAPHAHIKEHNLSKISIECKTLSAMLHDENPTFINIDALTSDMDILRGGNEIIAACHPAIIVEMCTYSENMHEVIPFLRKINSMYLFKLGLLK